jgi:DNA repair exonuclease SbcCD ATPase subunit
MTEADSKTAEPRSREQARARALALARAESELRASIERERKGPPPTAKEVRAAVRQAQDAVDDIQKRIDAAKAEARTLKDKIQELERRHAEVPEAERMMEWPRLVNEKAHLLAQVGVREGLIASLEGQKLAATGALEAAKQRLVAFEAGVYARPMEEDPRLVSLREELSAATAALEGEKPRSAGGKKKKASKREPLKKQTGKAGRSNVNKRPGRTKRRPPGA